MLTMGQVGITRDHWRTVDEHTVVERIINSRTSGETWRPLTHCCRCVLFECIRRPTRQGYRPFPPPPALFAVAQVRTSQLEAVKRQPMDEAVFVHLDRGEVTGSVGMTPVPDICDGERLGLVRPVRRVYCRIPLCPEVSVPFV